MKVGACIMVVMFCVGLVQAQRIGAEGSEFMRRGVLASQLRNNPEQFFKNHIENRYTAHDGLEPMRITLVNVVQVISPGLILARDGNYDMFVIHHIRTDNMVDGEQLRVILVPRGIYEYTTVLGANKRVPSYVPGRPINYEEFLELRSKGHDFVSTVYQAETRRR